jgi:hypothetical protein
MDGQVCVDWNHFISWCIAGQLSISVILLLVGLLPWIPAMWFWILFVQYETRLVKLKILWSSCSRNGFQMSVGGGIIYLLWWNRAPAAPSYFRRCMQLILAVKNIVMKQCLIRLDGPLKDLLFDTDNHLFICYSFFYSLSFLRHVFLSCYYFILIFLIIIIILNNL